MILWWLHGRTYRFTESRRLIPEITEKMHNQQLRDIVHGRIYPTVHRSQYSLTEYGGSLSTPCRQFADWGGIQIKCTAAVEKAPQVLLKGRAKKESGVKNHNWRPDRRPVTIEELLLSSPAQTPLIEKGLISREEFVQKISEGAATHRKLLNFIVQ